jgi:hypothetical protein
MFIASIGSSCSRISDETGVSGGAEHLTAVAAYVFSTEGVRRYREMFRRDIFPLLPQDKHGSAAASTPPRKMLFVGRLRAAGTSYA